MVGGCIEAECQPCQQAQACKSRPATSVVRVCAPVLSGVAGVGAFGLASSPADAVGALPQPACRLPVVSAGRQNLAPAALAQHRRRWHGMPEKAAAHFLDSSCASLLAWRGEWCGTSKPNFVLCCREETWTALVVVKGGLDAGTRILWSRPLEAAWRRLPHTTRSMGAI